MKPYFDYFGNLNSIISKEPKCFFCSSKENLQIHHVFGNSLRDKCTKYGLYVFLCPKCHGELHFGKKSRKMTDRLKSVAQEAFERFYPRDLFLKEFHANFIINSPSIDIEPVGDLAKELEKG